MKKIFCILLLVWSCDNGSFLPQDFSWAHVDLDNDGVFENYLTDTKSQAGGNCVIYSVIGLLEAQFKIDHLSTIELNLSEQNIHNCLRYPNGGAADEIRIFRHLKQFGVMEEHHAPTGLWTTCHNCVDPYPTMLGVVPIKQIPFYGLEHWKYVISYKETKSISYQEKRRRIVEALQFGPVLIDAHSWPGFVLDPITGTTYCKTPIPGGHATIVVGYENNGEIFLIKNSYAEGRLLRVLFDGAERCGLFHAALQISDTFVRYGSGQDFCFDSLDDDDDMVPTAIDNCPWNANQNQENKDNDLLGDACDPCPDGFNWFDGYYCN